MAEGAHPSNWIRPVSNRENESISERERRYADGNDPELLDIIDVPLLNPKPKGYQQENWLLNTSRQWRKVGRLSSDDLPQLADPEAPRCGPTGSPPVAARTTKFPWISPPPTTRRCGWSESTT